MIVPIILCGGSGTRLWPVSRQSYPKQFSKLLGDLSLFQSCVKRFDSEEFSSPIVVTHSDFRFIVAEQMHEICVEPMAILIEPERKNTAPAVLVATLFAQNQNPNAKIVVAPSDHLIPEVDAFHRALDIGYGAVEQQKMVTFGIEPTHAEIAYGYLELAESFSEIRGHCPLERFVEKPNLAQAEEMLATNRYLWNTGIFLAAATDMIENYRKHAPCMLKAVKQSLANAVVDLDFCRLDIESWHQLESISVDYAVMEKASNLCVVPYWANWFDLGDWRAVWEQGSKNASGVVLSGNANAIECHNSLIRSDSDGLEIIGIGLEDIIAVAMHDAVLVAHKSKVQEVKQAVAQLTLQNRPQAEIFPKKHRPWGWYMTLFEAKHCQARWVYIKPGARQSLQSHAKRSEHWIVSRGVASVTLGQEQHQIAANQSIYIPHGVKHRLGNDGDTGIELVEIRTGECLNESDIERFDGENI